MLNPRLTTPEKERVCLVLQLRGFTFVQGIDILKFDKNPLIFSDSQFILGGLRTLFGPGFFTDRGLFRKLYYQTMPGGT